MNKRLRPLLSCIALGALIACAQRGYSPAVPAQTGAVAVSNDAALSPYDKVTTTPIHHLIIMVQENRSFDNFFARYPGADGATAGYNHKHVLVPLKKANLIDYDLNHMHKSFIASYDHGEMDGFDLNRFDMGGPVNNYPYQYIDPAQIAPYWKLAEQYVLADHMFQTQGSGSFTAHQDLIAGTTQINANEAAIDLPTHSPWGCDAPSDTVTSLITIHGLFLKLKGPFPCYQYPSMGELLDAKNVSWRYYAPPLNSGIQGGLWSAYDAIKSVRYGPDWKADVVSPETTIFGAISGNHLPAVSWLIPDIKNSDHPGSAGMGPQWVASVVNAVGESPEWRSTAIVIVWDDWGGFYDNVPPPRYGFESLGFRVPCLIVSPYARQHYVSHTQYEFGSILKFIEENWKLGSLGATDVRAASIADSFDFTAPPRAYKPIKGIVPRSYFENERPSYQPVDNE